MNTALNTRRKALIQALRSGKYRKGIHALFSQKVDYDKDEDGYVEPNTQSFCCLGVARCLIPTTVVPYNWVEDVMNSEYEELNEPTDYDAVSWYYGIDDMLKQYLMGMNDGSPVHLPNLLAREDGEEDDVVYTGRKIRKGDHPRSHVFIARYLELVWKL